MEERSQDDRTNDPFEQIFVRRWYQNVPLLSNQLLSNGVSFLTTGGLSDETTIVFKANMTSALSNKVRLQVEVQPIGTAFSGSPTAESLLVSSGDEAVVTLTDLSKGSKHWRARTVDAQGFASQWVSFGGNADGDTDFAVLEYTKTGGGGGSSCGLTGIEAFLLLGIFLYWRRFR